MNLGIAAILVSLPSPSDGTLRSEGIKQGWGGVNKTLDFMRQYLNNGRRYGKSYY